MKRNYVSTQAIEHSNPTGRHDHAVAKIDAAIKIVREQLYLQPERRSAFDDLVALIDNPLIPFGGRDR